MKAIPYLLKVRAFALANGLKFFTMKQIMFATKFYKNEFTVLDDSNSVDRNYRHYNLPKI